MGKKSGFESISLAVFDGSSPAPGDSSDVLEDAQGKIELTSVYQILL
jgi:hypothetical protein